MTKNYEFNENLAIVDIDTHAAVVEKLNRIEEFAQNKKYEWVDEEIPEDNYNVSFNENEWLDYNLGNAEYEYRCFDFEIPENLREEIANYVNDFKDYVDGFAMDAAFLYNKKMGSCKSFKTSNFDDVVNYMKEVRENNKFVFLYAFWKVPERQEEKVIKEDKVTRHLLPCNSYYYLRCGVVND